MTVPPQAAVAPVAVLNAEQIALCKEQMKILSDLQERGNTANQTLISMLKMAFPGFVPGKHNINFDTGAISEQPQLQLMPKTEEKTV